MPKRKRAHATLIPTSPNEPRQQASPSATKTARSVESNVPRQTPIWSFQIIDTEGPWCLTNITKTLFVKLLGRMGHFETMKWCEIEGKENHFVSCAGIVPKAQKRLVEIGQDEADNLFSFVIQGGPRLWGIRAGRVFRVLWWDPEHEVWSSKKKHT